MRHRIPRRSWTGSAALSKESGNLMPATIGGRTAHRLERG